MKKTVEEHFYTRKNKTSLELTFNISDFTSSFFQKHLGKQLKLLPYLPSDMLLRLLRSFLRLNLDYGHITYKKRNNDSFKNRTESIQYKVCTAITKAILGTSRERAIITN